MTCSYRTSSNTNTVYMTEIYQTEWETTKEKSREKMCFSLGFKVDSKGFKVDSKLADLTDKARDPDY